MWASMFSNIAPLKDVGKIIPDAIDIEMRKWELHRDMTPSYQLDFVLNRHLPVIFRICLLRYLRFPSPSRVCAHWVGMMPKCENENVRSSQRGVRIFTCVMLRSPTCTAAGSLPSPRSLSSPRSLISPRVLAFNERRAFNFSRQQQCESRTTRPSLSPLSPGDHYTVS